MNPEWTNIESPRLPEMKWAAIKCPGSYLVTQTGRLIRVTHETLYDPDVLLSLPPSSWMARISVNPTDPAVVLRQVASAHGYFVNF